MIANPPNSQSSEIESNVPDTKPQVSSLEPEVEVEIYVPMEPRRTVLGVHQVRVVSAKPTLILPEKSNDE